VKIGKRRNEEKLNLIPILDSVFIFIFFLLMSAQFLDLYEIGSDVPIVKSLPSSTPDKKALNLTLEIHRDSVIVKKGLDGRRVGKVVKESGKYNVEKLKQILVNIKRMHRAEKQIILKPHRKVSYKEIVQVMDVVRAYHQTSEAREERLFNKIVFDTIGS
jgi:biopolymer transport protein ExbD